MGATQPPNMKVKLHLEIVEPDIDFSESLLNLLSVFITLGNHMDFLPLKASEYLKISGEISNMKFDIIVRPFVCSVPPQKVFRFEFLKSHGTQNRLNNCSTSVWKSQPSVNHSVHTIARWITCKINETTFEIILVRISDLAQSSRCGWSNGY